MFIYAVITYAVGIILYFNLLHTFVIALPITIPSTVFIILFGIIFFLWLLKLNTKYLNKHTLILFAFFTSGLFFSYFHYLINPTILLKEEVKFKKIYGEVYKIESPIYANKQYIYLKNIVIPEITTQDTPSTAKLTASAKTVLEKGDIITATTFLFPPADTLFPYGVNFKQQAFFNHIGANGFVVGKIRVIENTNPHNNYLALIDNFFINLKHKLAQGIKENSSPQVAPFLIAISLGEYSFLPKQDLNNLRLASLSHLISISGSHITLITILLFVTFRLCLVIIPSISLRFDIKKITSILTILCLVFYLKLIGDNTPALRAGIMSIAFLLAILCNIKVFSLNSLFLAGLIILILQPYYLFSASFLLSFFATLALITFWNSTLVQKAHRFSQQHFLYRIVFFILLSVFATLFIELSITPIIMFYFGTIPLTGILSNTLASPLFTFIITPPLIGYFLTPLFIGKYLLVISSLGMKLLLTIAAYCASLPISVIYAEFFPAYLLLIFLFAYLLVMILPTPVRYIFIMPCITAIAYYVGLVKSPDIIIDSQGSSVAVQQNNNYYFAQGSNKFVQSVWLKSPHVNVKNLFSNSNNFQCEKNHCLTQIKGLFVSIANNGEYYQEDCNTMDLIVLQHIQKPFTCSSAETIDNNFLNKHGSTAIYIDKSRILIKSTH